MRAQEQPSPVEVMGGLGEESLGVTVETVDASLDLSRCRAKLKPHLTSTTADLQVGDATDVSLQAYVVTS